VSQEALKNPQHTLRVFAWKGNRQWSGKTLYWRRRSSQRDSSPSIKPGFVFVVCWPDPPRPPDLLGGFVLRYDAKHIPTPMTSNPTIANLIASIVTTVSSTAMPTVAVKSPKTIFRVDNRRPELFLPICICDANLWSSEISWDSISANASCSLSDKPTVASTCCQRPQ